MRGKQQSEQQKRSGGSSLDKWRKKYEQQEEKRKSDWAVVTPEGVETFKQEEKGDRYLKLIGYVTKDARHPDADPGDIAWRRPYQIHRNIGPENKAVVGPCTFGKRCPVCEAREQYRAGRSDSDKEMASALNFSRRSLYLVVDVDERKPKYYLLDQPMSMGKAPGFGRMLEEEVVRLDAAEAAPWDDDGPILEVRFGKDSYDGRAFYPVTKLNLLDPKDLPDMSNLPEPPCLDDCLNVLSYDQIKKILYGIDDDDTAEESKEERPSRSRGERAKEEDEPPRRGRGSKEEEKSEEEEERPRRGRRPEPDPDPEPKGELPETRSELLKLMGEADREELNDICDKLDLVPPKRFSGDTNNTRKGMQDYREWVMNNLPEQYTEKEEKEEPPRGRGRGQAKEESGDCPGGHTFGEDCDQKDECKTCKKWKECADQYDELEKQKKKKK